MKTLYYNGKIYTGTDTPASAFLVEDEIITAVGSTEELLKIIGEPSEVIEKANGLEISGAAAKVAESEPSEVTLKSAKSPTIAHLTPEVTKIDLHGHFVSPGFIDSHMHLLGFGQLLNSVPLAAHTDSLADMLDAMKQFHAQNPLPQGQWLIGRGWNHDYYTDVHRMPDRDDLDQISTEIPVCVVRCCGHCLVLNSKALELVGATIDTPTPDGGTIGQENGRLDGRFFDNAMGMVYEKIPTPDKATIKQYIATAARTLNTYGVTSCHTDDYSTFRQVPWQIINEAYQELEQEGLLTVRVYEQSNFDSLQTLTEFVEAGNYTGKGSNNFKIGPLKMLGDGSLGARTAYLTQPYADDPSTTGLPVFTPQTFEEMIGYANAHDMQVAIHAIGDRCLDDVLSAIEKALQENPKSDHRHGIVHCQITRPDQLDKISDLKLHVYAQTIFLDYDIHIVEDRVGPTRAATSYSWKSLMNQGISVSNGTDCPVEYPNALGGIQCAVTRTTLKDHLGPYLPDQAFTVREALDSYTIRGAEGSFEEKIKGKIASGYLADFVILDQSPFDVEPEQINEIKVLATYLGGKLILPCYC